MHCAACHGRDLRGTEGGNALVGEQFVGKWSAKSVGQLVDLTKASMPKTNPHSLDDIPCASLIAFILNRRTPGGRCAFAVNDSAVEDDPHWYSSPSSKVSI